MDLSDIVECMLYWVGMGNVEERWYEVRGSRDTGLQVWPRMH